VLIPGGFEFVNIVASMHLEPFFLVLLFLVSDGLLAYGLVGAARHARIGRRILAVLLSGPVRALCAAGLVFVGIYWYKAVQNGHAYRWYFQNTSTAGDILRFAVRVCPLIVVLVVVLVSDDEPGMPYRSSSGGRIY